MVGSSFDFDLLSPGGTSDYRGKVRYVGVKFADVPPVFTIVAQPVGVVQSPAQINRTTD